MAVYTEISNDELAAFVAAYDIGTVTSLKGIAEGVENSNFLLTTDRATYILTLYEKRVAEPDLPFFLGLMEHLAERGIACPLPLRSRDGRALHRLAGRPAAIITFLDGMWPKRIHPFHCRELGAALARLHLAGSDFPMRRDNDLSLGGWQQIFGRCRDDADRVMPGLSDAVARELAGLEAVWPAALPTGVIHADLFPDNVFFIGETLTGLIDFYFACTDAFAYDLAICLNAWCFEPDGAFNVTKARLMLASYRRVRPFSTAELAALPILARGAALRFLLTRLFDWLNHPPGAFVKPKDPLEYWHKLRFHQGVAGPGAYGLD
ncbi:MAG: homoserine kinase [Alphaproteobacteria bacterium]|jgi:homoserine kinase type II|nr:homoserine kinase [Alphaproteobacteria bacterium]